MSDKKLFLLLLVWSVLVLLLLSPDSPIHGPWNRVDSAIFFTSGKALMNGMRPYVDFADSKGPLLWLIYGIGYLLSPRSYTGVYVVSCLWYAGIFYYNFKTARIFLKDDQHPMAVTLLMTFAYFLQWFHFEVRAEDFATLPVAVSLYYLFRLLYGCGSDAAQLTVRRCGLVLGGCFMALVLIKFSIAAMQGIIVLVMLWYMARERKEYIKPLAWLAVGAVAVALPFLGYLWMRGAVPAFIHEYFINTLSTVTVSDADGSRPTTIWAELAASWGNPASLALLMFMCYGGWLLGRQLSCYRRVPLLVGVFFFVLATRHNLGYYYCICHIFLIYLLVWSAGLSARPFKKKYFAYIVAAVVGWGVYLNVGKECQLHRIALWVDNEDRARYEHLSDAMSGYDNPRILNLIWSDDGYGLRQEALPAGKYWTHQYGSTKKMVEEHFAPLVNGTADFVIVNDELNCIRNGWLPGRIIACGYVRIFSDRCANGRTRAVYKRSQYK